MLKLLLFILLALPESGIEAQPTRPAVDRMLDSLLFISDSNTGIRRTGSDSLAIQTGGVTKILSTPLGAFAYFNGRMVQLVDVDSVAIAKMDSALAIVADSLVAIRPEFGDTARAVISDTASALRSDMIDSATVVVGDSLAGLRPELGDTARAVVSDTAFVLRSDMIDSASVVVGDSLSTLRPEFGDTTRAIVGDPAVLDTLNRLGVPLDSLFYGGQAVGTIVYQDTIKPTLDSLYVRHRVGIGTDNLTRTFQVRGDSAVSSTVARFELSNLENYFVLQMANTAPAHTGNYTSFESRVNSSVQERTAFAFRSRFSDITDATRTSSIELWSNEAGTFTSRFHFVGAKLGLGVVPDSTLTVTGSGRYSTHLRVGGNVYIGDTADSAAAHDLAIQAGTAWSRIDAGEADFEASSDGELKTGFTAVDTAAIRVAALALPPPRQWQYKLEALLNTDYLYDIRADSSQAAIDAEVANIVETEPLADREAVIAAVRAKRVAAVIEREDAYWQDIERKAAIKRTGWTAQELYPLSLAVRPEAASPTSIRLSDQVTALMIIVQAQQREIDNLRKRVEALEKP